MKKRFTLLPACVALLAGLCAPLHAAEYTDAATGATYTYEVSDTNATLTAVAIPAGVTELTLPSAISDGTTSYTVTAIGEEVFYNTSLTSVVIPEGVTTIGPYAFFYCSSLSSVTLPSTLTTIGQSAFASCRLLTSITLPASLTNIGTDAFARCTNLTSITLPDTPIVGFSGLDMGITDYSVFQISETAKETWDKVLYGEASVIDEVGVTFYYNVLEEESVEISYVELPKNTTTLTLPDAISDGTTTYPVTKLKKGLLRGSTTLTSVTLPALVEAIPDSCFYECPALESLTVPVWVTSIGMNAFAQCTNLASVTLPLGLTTIGDGAFRSCTALTEIVIPRTVTSIDECAFELCPSSASVIFLGEPPTVGVGAFYAMGSSMKGYYLASDKWTAALNGSTTWNNLTMEEITSTTFFWKAGGENATLTAVAIPSGITSIEVPGTVSDGTTSYTVTILGAQLFMSQTALSSVTLPSSLIEIEAYAFYGCEALSSISLPESLTTIGLAAFGACDGLTSVVIPESVTSIGEQAFSYCYTLASVTLPSKLTSISDYLFLYCVGLQTLDIPSTVTSIGKGTFAYTAFSSIVLPASIETIADDAFYWSLRLTNVTFLGEPPTMGTTVFGDAQKSITGSYLGTTEWVAELEENTDASTGLWNNLAMKEVDCSLPEGLTDEAAVKTRILAALEGQSSLPAIEVSGTSATIQDCMALGVSPSVSVTDSSATVAFEAPTLEVTEFDLAAKTVTFKVVPGSDNSLTQYPDFTSASVALYGADSLSDAMTQVTSDVSVDTSSYLNSGSEGTFTVELTGDLPAFLQLRVNE